MSKRLGIAVLNYQFALVLIKMFIAVIINLNVLKFKTFIQKQQ